MKTVRFFLGFGVAALVGCVSEVRDNPLDGKIVVEVLVPKITKVSPSKGIPGSVVTLKGENLGAADAKVVVKFGKEVTTPTKRTATVMTLVVPRTAPAGETEIAVSVAGTAAEPVTFAVAPLLTHLSRAAGYKGMRLTVEGLAFGPTQGSGRVWFGSVAADIESWADDSILVVVPAQQTAGGGPPGGGTAPASDVAVEAGGVLSETADFALFSAIPGMRCALPCNTPGSYTSMSSDGMPDPRQYHSAAWTGTELVIWGGQLATPLRVGTECVGDGARYNPTTDSWAPVQASGAPSARCRHVGVWTGTKLIVSGGTASTANVYATLTNGAAYNPANDSWVAIASMPHAHGETGVWSANRVVVWGGSVAASAVTSAGSLYNPVDNTVIATDPAPGGLTGHSAVAGGNSVFAWGGSDALGLTNAGYVLWPSATPATWTVMSATGAPSARTGQAAVYARGRMIIFGGVNGSTFYSDGKEYFPDSDTWGTITYQGGMATGTAFFGTGDGNTALIAAMSPGMGFNGFYYDPNAGGSGSALNSLNGPAPQKFLTVTWMNGEFAVFGGIPFSFQ